MIEDKFRGMGVAMVTPFTEEQSIDYKGLQKLTEYLIEKGADYLVVQGTTGETPTLSQEEKRAALDFILEINNGRLPIVLGMGGYNTNELIKILNSWDFSGVDAILSVTPYYNKPNQGGIYAHYAAVSKNSPVPVILYNVPSRTGVNMNWETTVGLANDFPNLIAVKEASGDMTQVINIIDNKPKDFLVISGDDLFTLPIIAMGGDGVISVVGNAFPGEFSQMVHQALNDQIKDARVNHYRLAKIIQAIFEEGNPAGIKEVLKNKSICENHLRLPLVKTSKKLSEKIYKIMTDGNLVVL